MVNLGRLDAMIEQQACDFCSLVVLGCKQNWHEKVTWEDVLLRGTNTTCAINALELERQQPTGYVTQLTVRHVGAPYQWLEFEVVLRSKEPLLEPVGRTLESYPKVDLGVLKRMFRDCEESHYAQHEATSFITLVPLFLIDLRRMRVVKVHGSTRRFCAPSYVLYQAVSLESRMNEGSTDFTIPQEGKPSESWLTLSRGNFTSLAQDNSLLHANIPRTIRDAMQVCLDISERFLSVDSLCIIQDDPVDLEYQINHMDFIYTEAAVTLVAAAGYQAMSGLAGVSPWVRSSKRQVIAVQDIEVSNALPRLKDTVNRSVWNTRGWTYQERMFSRRCNFFTDSQAYFACSKGVQYERKDHLLTARSTTERLTNVWKGTSTGKSTFVKQNVTDYTLRTLTSQADVLRAFQGVMNHMSEFGPFHYGIPAQCFEEALLWQPVGYLERGPLVLLCHLGHGHQSLGQ